MSEVSVVVPIYNAEKYLEKCIKSILKQTFSDFELILVNDGSIDKSLDICQKYEKRDKRIKVVDKKNEGANLARKSGVKLSNSDYVMFVDADDWIDKQMIFHLYNNVKQLNADIAVCNLFYSLGNGRLIKRKIKSHYFEKDRVYNKDQIRKEILPAYFHSGPFPPSLFAKLYKKSLLMKVGKYLDRVHFFGDDLILNTEVFLFADKITTISKTLYYYRHGGFTSKYMSSFFIDTVNGYEIQKEVIDEFYKETKEHELNGISIKLLQYLESNLCNLFHGDFSDEEIKNKMYNYVTNESIRECLRNSGCQSFFSKEYLNAIKHKEVNHLYEIGKKMYKRQITRKKVFKFLSLIS